MRSWPAPFPDRRAARLGIPSRPRQGAGGLGFSSLAGAGSLEARATRPHSPEQHAARRHSPRTMSAQPARQMEF
jgi:hypothetical protein